MPPHMKYVLIFGAAGGFISWVYSITVGTPMRLPMAAAVIACGVLGAAAALISVYVVANTDLTNLPRLMIFAMLSGIFWKPVIDSSVSFVNQKKDAAQADRKSEAALQQLAGAPDNPQLIVARATDATTDLLRTSVRLNDPDLQKEARRRTETLITEIASGAPRNPRDAELALRQIKEAAAETQNQDLALQADAQLRAVASLPRPMEQQPIEFRPIPPGPIGPHPVEGTAPPPPSRRPPQRPE